MSKFSNIYDIDGNLIRGANQGPFTIEETEKLVDDLTKKVQENPDNNVYKVYLNNAQKWLMHLYDSMSREDLMKRMSFITDSVQNAKDEMSEAEKEQLDNISKAMEELKEAYEAENDAAGTDTPENVEVIEPTTQEDMLVERDEVEPINMEEIIDERDTENIHTLHSGESETNEERPAE
jgi:hypothetical protein